MALFSALGYISPPGRLLPAQISQLWSSTFSNIQKGHVLLRMSVSLPPSLQNWECSCEWFSSLTLDIYQLQGTFSLHKDLNSTTFSNIQRIVATLDVCLASECPKKAAKTCMFSFLLLSTYKYQSLCSNISFLLKFLYVQRCSNSFNASLSAYESLKIHHARGMFSVFCSSLLGISWLRVAVFCSNIATPRPSQISKKKRFMSMLLNGCVSACESPKVNRNPRMFSLLCCWLAFLLKYRLSSQNLIYPKEKWTIVMFVFWPLSLQKHTTTITCSVIFASAHIYISAPRLPSSSSDISTGVRESQIFKIIHHPEMSVFLASKSIKRIEWDSMSFCSLFSATAQI